MKKQTKLCMVITSILILAIAFSGCAAAETFVKKLKGELVGNDYTIRQYDDFGNLVFTAYGDKIAMDCETDEAGEPSSYINITVDGAKWQHVGSTLVFSQAGVDLITDFSVPETMENEGGSSGLIGVDRVINNYKNQFGKKLVVLVSSQNGTPVGLFQGNKCYVEIPEDLPKTTLINIDGKLVYVHRANVDILPASMFDSE
ncbi:MAG: DUF5052 family protein [Firmicutes bacterium]|nr:DUF5052 family protein [Bacillota bacterium]